MEEDNLVSVIVPVYMVEKTLERCFDSILQQTYDHYMILLIDDGSPDDSAKKCDRFAEKYDNVIVVHKENEGLGPTRNIGLLLSEGKYVYQMDSDDWIDERLLESAYQSAEENNAELVIFAYRLYTEINGGLTECGLVRADNCVINGIQNARAYFAGQLGNSFFVLSACNKFFRRDFILHNQIRFKPLRRSQDVVFALDVFDSVSKLVVLDAPLYHYTIIPGVFKKNASVENFLEVYEEMKKHFLFWNMYSGEMKRKTDYLYLSQIFNFVSFKWLHTADAAARRKLIEGFIDNNRIRNLSGQLKTADIPSRFIRGIKRYYDAKIDVGVTVYFWLHSLIVKLSRH